MAVTAIDAEFGSVVPVTEGNWLAACYVDFRDIGRPVDGIDGIAQSRQNEHRAIDAESRKGISAAVKYLSHPISQNFSVEPALVDLQSGPTRPRILSWAVGFCFPERTN
jgi:hypothetical protein